MTTIRKNHNTKFGYEMVKDDKVLPITSRTNDGYLRLPEMVNGRKLISLKQLERDMVDDELVIDDLAAPIQRQIMGAPKKPESLSWTRYVAEEDLEMFNQIKERALKRQTRAELEAQIEAQKKALAEMMAKLNEEA